MKILSESDILEIMREEWDKKVAALTEAIDVAMPTKQSDGDEKTVISPELKLKHKSGILYTVDSIGPRDIILRTPEGEKFLVDAQTLENEYNLA